MNKHSFRLGQALAAYICEAWKTDGKNDWDLAKRNTIDFVTGFFMSQGLSADQIAEEVKECERAMQRGLQKN